jgi:hypothetical protein
MEWPQLEQKMGPCQLGQGLQAQILRWSGPLGPWKIKQHHGSKNLAEMAQNTSRDLGKTLEMKIRPKHASKSTHKNVGENPRLQHLEYGLEKPATHTGTRLLGSSQWPECPILDGLLATNATPTTGRKSTILRKSHSRSSHSQSGRFADKYPQQLSLVKLEIYSSGTPSGNGL